MIPPKTLYVVSGLPRSGTSLLMQMAAAAGREILQDGLRAPDDSNPYGYFECERVKTLMDDSSWLHAEAGKVVKIVLPLLPFLPPGLPCKVALVRRDLGEVITSQTAMLSRMGLEPTATTDQLRANYDLLSEQIVRSLANRTDVTIAVFEHAKLIAKESGEIIRFLHLLGKESEKQYLLHKCIDRSLYRSHGKPTTH